MSNIKFVKYRVLRQLDLLCVCLSLIYSYFYFFGPKTFGGLQPFLVLFPLTYCAYLAKKRNKVVYSAMAYAFFCIMFISTLHLQMHPYLLFIPLSVFIIVMIMEISTSFLSGVIYGYWILFFYFFYQGFQSEKEVFNQIVQQFSPSSFEAILGHLLFLVLVGIILAVVTIREEYKFNGYWIEKLDYTLFLLSFGYVYFLFKGEYSKEALIVMILYLFISYTTLLGKNKESNLFCALSNAAVSFVFCYWLKVDFGIHNFYFLLLVPLIIFILMYGLKFHNYIPSGMLLAYWLSVVYQLSRIDTNFTDWGSMLQLVFSYQVVLAVLDQFIMLVISGIILGYLAKFSSKLAWEKPS